MLIDFVSNISNAVGYVGSMSPTWSLEMTRSRGSKCELHGNGPLIIEKHLSSGSKCLLTIARLPYIT